MSYDYDKDFQDRTRFAQDEMNRRQQDYSSNPDYSWVVVGVIIFILLAIFG